MKELTLLQTQQVAGAVIYMKGCKVVVPSIGLTTSIYNAIESCVQYRIDYPYDDYGFQKKALEAMSLGVTNTHLDIYEKNMEKAVWTCPAYKY